MSENDGENGLVIPEGASRSSIILPSQDRRNQGGIIVPDRGIIQPNRPGENTHTITESGLAVPNRPTERFTALTDSELMQYTAKNEEKPKSNRTIADQLRAQANPEVFLFNAVSGGFSESLQAEYAEVLGHLNPHQPTTEWSSEALNRRDEKVSYYDRYQDQTIEYTVSKPGPLETVATSMVQVMRDPVLNPSLFLDSLSKLITEYRSENNLLLLPAMPNLTQELSALCDQYKNRKQLRNAIYTLMQHIEIPVTQQQDIVRNMDKAKDLEHPLAFRLTTETALAQSAQKSTNKESNQGTNWLEIQQNRRQELLKILEGDAQELYDKFPLLLAKSQGLVCATDVFNIPHGNVGIEVEFQIRWDKDGEEDETLLQGNWDVGYDMGDHEIRRNDEKINYDLDYMVTISELAQWLRIEAERLKSIHIHVDRKGHSSKPELNGLIDGEFKSGWDEAVHKNELGTWEMRGLNLPQGEGSIHPARIADAIALYMKASEPGAQNRPATLLTISQGESLSIAHLTWGHLCQTLTAPEARLAALMTLHDSKVLANISPIAFIHSYEQESLPKISEFLAQTLKDKTDRKLAQILPRIKNEPVSQIWGMLDFNAKKMLLKGLQYDASLLKPYFGEVYMHGDTNRIKGNNNEYYQLVEELMRVSATDPNNREAILQWGRDSKGNLTNLAIEALVAFPKENQDILVQTLSGEITGYAKRLIMQGLSSLPEFKQILINRIFETESTNERYSLIDDLGSNFQRNEESIREIIRRNDPNINAILFNVLRNYSSSHELLVEAFASSENNELSAQAINLMVRKHATFWPQIETMLTSGNEFQKYQLYNALLVENEYGVYEKLVDIIKNEPNIEIRKRVYSRCFDRPNFNPAPLRQATQDPSPEIRKAALLTVLDSLLYGEYVELFNNDPDPEIQKLLAIGRNDGSKEYRDKITPYINDESKDVRIFVKNQLLRSGSLQEIESFGYQSQDTETQIELIKYVMRRTADPVPLLQRVFQNTQIAEIRAEALQQLANHLNVKPELVAIFKQALKDASPEIRRIAITEIVKHGKLDFRTFVSAVINSDSEVRRTAWKNY